MRSASQLGAGRGAVCDRCGQHLLVGSEAYLVDAPSATIKLDGTVVRRGRQVVRCIPCVED